MLDVFRIAPWRAKAKPGQPGHAFFIAGQGRSRVDNPDLYRVLYVSDSPAGAFAEVFIGVETWSQQLFDDLKESQLMLLTFELTDDRVVDLDDPSSLVRRKLRPSNVVTPERTVTQAWARSIYRERRWAGVRWWSRIDSRWSAAGLWDLRALKLKQKPEPLHIEHPAVLQAADRLDRVLET